MVKKSTPKGIDPAYPQKNFVKASFENKGETDGYSDYMYGNMQVGATDAIVKKASGYRHSIGQRAGKLRYSGMSGAHRIGKR